MPHIYEDHLSGNIFTSDEELEYEDLYCETCGDSDTYIGYAETDDEVEAVVNNYYKTFYED